ncbi:hypothetical protein EYF80_055489 [Liparis tanakae]|uniref:Uncharacterized protein n=1 Tax=Liparis tanakae TaxID=230148 RepID=A0A4Z2F067_9TELE|nr:hypothetical protein EYF80_055489 [Liparis tanakae]
MDPSPVSRPVTFSRSESSGLKPDPPPVPSSLHLQIKVSRQLRSRRRVGIRPWEPTRRGTQTQTPHPGGAGHVGGVGVEVVADVPAPRHLDVHVQVEVSGRRLVDEVLRQRLEHHHGGLRRERSTDIKD